MATRTRSIYQCDMVYVGPTGAFPCTGWHFTQGGSNAYGSVAPGITSGDWRAHSGVNLVQELFRVQSANTSWNRSLVPINQFGELAAIDRISIAQPTVPLDVTWLVANLFNERCVGLTISTGSQVSAISGILNTTSDSKNYFIRTVAEGSDVVGLVDLQSEVIGIGNGFISSYSTQGSVGNFPTATINIEGLNVNWTDTITGQCLPAVNPVDGTLITGLFYALQSPSSSTATQNPYGGTINTDTQNISVLRPGNITLNLGLGVGDGFVAEGDMKAQSYNIGFDLSRNNLEKLGSKYAFAKVINFPVDVKLSVTADVGDMQTGSLIEVISNNTTFNPSITIKNADNSKTICYYQIRGAKLESQEMSSSIGPNKSVTMSFVSQLSGPTSVTAGLFLSGIA
jgi:hypothetical protein